MSADPITPIATGKELRHFLAFYTIMGEYGSVGIYDATEYVVAALYINSWHAQQCAGDAQGVPRSLGGR